MTKIIMCINCGTPYVPGCHTTCEVCKKSFNEPEDFIDSFDRLHPDDEDLDEFIEEE